MADSKVRNSTTQEKEVWKKIDGFDYYEVSNQGRIRSLDKKMKIERSNQYASYTETRIKKGCIRKPADNGNGYLVLPLKHLGEQTMVYIHREVAKAFIPNPENKTTVNHVDGDKTNNHVDNLEWATYSENQQHAYDKGLAKYEKGYKLTETQVLEIRSAYKLGCSTYKELADEYDISIDTIGGIVNRRTWTHI